MKFNAQPTFQLPTVQSKVGQVSLLVGRAASASRRIEALLTFWQQFDSIDSIWAHLVYFCALLTPSIGQHVSIHVMRILFALLLCFGAVGCDRASNPQADNASVDSSTEGLDPSATTRSARTKPSEDPRCRRARRLAAKSLQGFWDRHVTTQIVASVEAQAIFETSNLWNVAKTELEKDGCSYEKQFANFDAALSRVNLDSGLADLQIQQVSEALANLTGRASGISVRRPDRSGSETLHLGDVARLEYFTVSVTAYRAVPQWQADVTVCYTHVHPGANSDGTTRVSTDPWSFRAVNSTGVRFLPTSRSKGEGNTQPEYHETLLRVGECQTGWMTVGSNEPGQFSGMRYAPRDFAQSATWGW